MLTNTRLIRVQWGDCDPAGIVFYPRYFAMFYASTAALFARAFGGTKKAMLRHYDVVGFPMVDTRATFSVPCAFGDEVQIESAVTEFRRASFDVRHRLLRDDGATLAVEGFETRVWVGRHPDKPDGIKALPIPEDLIARFRDPPGAP
jgi:4-hydroxybenzoyl-CoA thioesterase